MTTDTLGRARSFELTILDHAAEMLPTTYGNAIIEAAVLIADLRDALTVALTREPSEADVEMVARAILKSKIGREFGNDYDVVANHYWLEAMDAARAAIAAMAPGSGGMGEG